MIRDRFAQPPDEVFFAAGAGPKRVYETLQGLRSAFKTSGLARYHTDQRSVYRGKVEWVEIDLETGLELIPSPQSVHRMVDHLSHHHSRLLDVSSWGVHAWTRVSEVHTSDHEQVRNLNHVHPKEQDQ